MGPLILTSRMSMPLNVFFYSMSKVNKTTSSLFPLFIWNKQKFRTLGNSLMLQQYSSNEDHRHFRSRMDVNVQNMFEINYSHLIQYEILEKLVT